jgi:hypothetical protein
MANCLMHLRHRHFRLHRLRQWNILKAYDHNKKGLHNCTGLFLFI